MKLTTIVCGEKLLSQLNLSIKSEMKLPIGTLKVYFKRQK